MSQFDNELNSLDSPEPFSQQLLGANKVATEAQKHLDLLRSSTPLPPSSVPQHTVQEGLASSLSWLMHPLQTLDNALARTPLSMGTDPSTTKLSDFGGPFSLAGAPFEVVGEANRRRERNEGTEDLYGSTIGTGLQMLAGSMAPRVLSRTPPMEFGGTPVFGESTPPPPTPTRHLLSALGQTVATGSPRLYHAGKAIAGYAKAAGALLDKPKQTAGLLYDNAVGPEGPSGLASDSLKFAMPEELPAIPGAGRKPLPAKPVSRPTPAHLELGGTPPSGPMFRAAHEPKIRPTGPPPKLPDALYGDAPVQPIRPRPELAGLDVTNPEITAGSKHPEVPGADISPPFVSDQAAYGNAPKSQPSVRRAVKKVPAGAEKVELSKESSRKPLFEPVDQSGSGRSGIPENFREITIDSYDAKPGNVLSENTKTGQMTFVELVTPDGTHALVATKGKDGVFMRRLVKVRSIALE